MYTAHVLTSASREALTHRFPPKYPTFYGHHVTVQFGVKKGTPAPKASTVRVVGHVDSGDGLEVLVVSVNGQTTREDGNTYHITWSINPDSGYAQDDSNKLLQSKRYTIVRPITILTNPSVLD